MEQDFEVVKYYAQDIILFIKDFKVLLVRLTLL